MRTLALLVLLAACSAEQPLDPSGTWAMMLTFGDGTCGITQPTPANIIVVQHGANYSVSDPGADAVSGSIVCTADNCTLTYSETAHGQTAADVAFTAELIATLGLDTTGAIGGDGMLTAAFADGSRCEQTFTAIGVLR